MTTYTKRDIRAADMLAMILSGFGVVLFVFAALPLITGKTGKGGTSPTLWTLATVFVALGVALHLKIKQLVRNQGREPEDYPGVHD